MQTPASTIVHTGDLGGEKIAMGIDHNALAHIMSVLTDLYSDPQAAVIREYSTNAWDAHIEAGITDPIEVFTPSGFSPYFRIVDHGVGLSIDDIKRIYSQYGASTKRSTDAQTGMLGLGCKSALTLVPQFNLTSRKDGVEIFVSIFRSSDGTGMMEIVDTKGTDRPNGVEISIPMQRSGIFSDKVNNFFRFWESGTVLVDGSEPKALEGKKVGKRFIVNKGLRQDYVVMGGVAYPVKDGIYREGAGYYYEPHGIVAYVEIGDVNFTPSREALMYTPRTKQTLEALKIEFGHEMKTAAQKDVDACANHFDAWTAAREWKTNFSIKGLTYKKKEVPSGDIETNKFRCQYIGGGRSYGRWGTATAPQEAKKFLFIVNFTGVDAKMSPNQRKKARQYCIDNKLGFTEVAATRDAELWADVANKPFFSGFTIVDWKDIECIKIARDGTSNYVPRTDPYDLYSGPYKISQVSDFDVTKPIVYFSSAELNEPAWMHKVFGEDAQVVRLNRNRWDKFKRDWPTAQHYRDAMAKTTADLIGKLTDDDKILWNHSSNYNYSQLRVDCKDIDDPDLANFVRVVGGKTEYSDAAKGLQAIKSYVAIPPIVCPDDPLTKYPLHGSLRYVSTDHAIWYLNNYYKELI